MQKNGAFRWIIRKNTARWHLWMLSGRYSILYMMVCRRSHSFFRMAYCMVFSYLGVPSGLFTKEMNSKNTPSRRIPSFLHRCWLERL